MYHSHLPLTHPHLTLKQTHPMHQPPFNSTDHLPGFKISEEDPNRIFIRRQGKLKDLTMSPALFLRACAYQPTPSSSTSLWSCVKFPPLSPPCAENTPSQSIRYRELRRLPCSLSTGQTDRQMMESTWDYVLSCTTWITQWRSSWSWFWTSSRPSTPSTQTYSLIIFSSNVFIDSKVKLKWVLVCGHKRGECSWFWFMVWSALCFAFLEYALQATHVVPEGNLVPAGTVLTSSDLETVKCQSFANVLGEWPAAFVAITPYSGDL